MTWRESNLSYWNLYFTLEGRGEIHVGESVRRIEAGDLVLLPPKLERTYRVPESGPGWTFYWLHFRLTAQLRKVGDFERRRVIGYHVSDPGLRLRIAATLEEMNQINLRAAGLLHRERLMEILTESVLLRVAGARELQRHEVSGVDPRVAAAVEAIHRQIAGAHSLDTLARHAGLSRSQFCLLFREGMNRSPQAYLEERRLEMARFYLTTTVQSVAEIAAMVGYADPFYFTHRFRRFFGQSPRDLRRSLKNKKSISPQ